MSYTALALCAILFCGCVNLDETVPAVQNPGLKICRPEAGQSDRFVRFEYGKAKSPDSIKTYRKDILTLSIRAVDDSTIFMEQKMCEEGQHPCRVDPFRILRKSGTIVTDSAGYIPLAAVNVFPGGIFARNDDHEIAFQGNRPLGDTATIGFKREHRIGSTQIQKSIVLFDPSGIDIDVGGFCLIMSEERRILEMYRYIVFGTDGGWELILE